MFEQEHFLLYTIVTRIDLATAVLEMKTTESDLEFELFASSTSCIIRKL